MMTEMENFIQLKKDSILRFGIKTSDGVDTGEHLEFDLEDIELPLRINQCEAMHRKNLEYLKMQFVIIDKKEDKKGKYILSWREEEKMKVLQEFYKKEMEALDLFLGKGGTEKLLNGRKPYATMYQDINEMLEPIMPKLEVRTNDIIGKIKNKYGKNKEEDVLE
jgi:hypothetical protein